MGLTNLTSGRTPSNDAVVQPKNVPNWKEFFDGSATKTFVINTYGILILTDGNLDFKLKDDDTANTIAVKAGMLIPCNVDVITITTTTCSGIVLGF